MLIKNHLFFSLVLAGITLTISNTSLADSPGSFTSLSQCRSHFNTSIQVGNESTEASDPWCKSRMSALDFCTEQALLNAITTNSYNASQIPAVRQSLQTTCQQQLATQATAPATTPVASNTPGAAFDASGAPRPPTAPAQQNCAAVPTAEQAACNVRLAQYQRDLQTYQSNLQAYNQRQAAAAQQAQQQRQQQQQQNMQAGMQGTQMMLNAMAPLMDGRSESGGGGQTVVREVVDSNGTVIRRETTVTEGGGGAVPSDAEVSRVISQSNQTLQQSGLPSGENPSALQQAANNGVQQVDGANLGQPTSDAARGVAGSTRQGTDIPAGRTANVSGMSPEQRRNLQARIDAGQSLARAVEGCFAPPAAAAATPPAPPPAAPSSAPGADMGAPVTATPVTGTTKMALAINELNTALATFDQQKLKCEQNAERANKLCLESPGMKTVKTLMDVSGPVLALIGSAQKACSSTRKVTNLAAIGLTAAKGVCVASKAICDMSCGATRAKLTTIVEGIETKIAAALEADFATALTADKATAPATPKSACVRALQPLARTTIAGYGTVRLNENTINVGTTAGLIANCQKMSKEILLMATNVMGLAMAKMSAQKCEQQLATAGGAAGSGSEISTADYCSNPATSGTDFCKCQSNPTAEGCSGNLSSGGAVGEAANQIGANLKAGQGPNGFAGGGARAGGGSNFNLRGGNGTDSTGAALSGLEGGGSAFGAQSGSFGGSVAGSAGGAAGATPAAAAAAADKAADKKWNFGSFVGSGGGTGARSGQGGGNGNLSSQQQEAIERRIASEKYAAEITTSSGASNFDKIKKAVRMISSTLDPNQ